MTSRRRARRRAGVRNPDNVDSSFSFSLSPFTLSLSFSLSVSLAFILPRVQRACCRSRSPLGLPSLPLTPTSLPRQVKTPAGGEAGGVDYWLKLATASLRPRSRLAAEIDPSRPLRVLLPLLDALFFPLTLSRGETNERKFGGVEKRE